MASDIRLVLVTAPEDSAGRVADAVLESRLAACANVFAGVVSRYWWKEALETARESLILFKTTAEKAGALRERVLAVHPYEVPEIVEVAVDAGHAPYLEWVRSSCG